MPVTTNYPGGPVEDLPNGVHTIAGVSTSIAAFVGAAGKGPENDPLTIDSFGDFERIFGGLSNDCGLGFAVRDFFRNGGSQGVVVRVTAANGALHDNDFIADEPNKKGIYALEKADIFNLLVIPPYDTALGVSREVIAAAAAYCEKRRAMLLVDPPLNWTDAACVVKASTNSAAHFIGTRSSNAAIFFPAVLEPNPLRENQLQAYPPSAAVAGVLARTDAKHGVWKAPAGADALLVGVPQLSVSLTERENEMLNALGINCLRSFPKLGCVVWGSRTLAGADTLAGEYKYIPVRRLALYIEESLYRGTKWVVFEPDGEPLWAQIRLNVGAFLQTLFRQGAFQGTTPSEAYFVKCDKETMTQNDIDLGVVNIVVGLAPLKPAEFVIIRIQQIAGRNQSSC